ncbi:hypothetical protein [Pseudomonas sp. MAG733B]|uniref:hypothetical protein n=1 Tax=Pseudomonas sp. MAG733B TaxID=3122079 RepID=UPI0030D51A85
MPLALNSTSTRGVWARPTTNVGAQPRTSTSNTVLAAGNSTGRLRHPVTEHLPARIAPDSDIAPPVLDCSSLAFKPVFADQADLDQRWAALKQYLASATLPEQEILDVLSSGILQTDTGKAMSGLFASAMLRSIRRPSTLSKARLKNMVDVLCHLPPSQWQAALGEKTRFSSDQGAKGVVDYIQSRLDVSSALRDRKIAGKDLVSDAQWEAIKSITQDTRQYVCSINADLFSAWLMLKDDCELRPSPKDALKNLTELIAAFSNTLPGNDHFVDKVEAVCDQFKPGYQGVSPAPMEGKPDALISLRFNRPLKSEVRSGADNVEPLLKPIQPQDPAPTLLGDFQRFESHANFYTSAGNSGPRIPESFAGKFLYVCNALDTFGALKLDSSHISTGRPLDFSGKPETEGGISNLQAPSIDFSGPQSDATPITVLSPATLRQFAAQVDDIFNRVLSSITPWSSAYADELDEVVVMLNQKDKDLTAEGSVWSSLPDTAVLGERLRDWLARMSGRLLDSGVAVLSQTGNLIERNPGRSLATFSLYVALTNLYNHWFLPDVKDWVDPLAGVAPEPDDTPDEAFFIFEKTLEGIDEIFEELPEFADAVRNRISESEYLDPSDDPQLIEDIEAILQQSVPGMGTVTYQDYLQDVIELARLDAQSEFEIGPENDSATFPEPTQNSVSTLDAATAKARNKRSGEEDAAPSSSKKAVSEVSAPVSAPAHWLIEAGQRSLNADDSATVGEKNTADVMVGQAAESFIKALDDLQLISDPSIFIRTVIDEAIASSNLPAHLKFRLNFKKKFKVEFRLRSTEREDHKPLFQYRYKEFDLAQLFAGQHKKERAWREEIFISWPDGCTAEFKATIEQNDFEAAYKLKIDEVLSQPGIFELWKLDKQNELRRILKVYLQQPGLSAENQKIANDFLDGKLKAQTISIRDGALSTPDEVSNALYLRGPKDSPGLFVFFGVNSTVIEYPLDLLQGTKSIEKFPELRDQLSKRISLKEFLGRDASDFKYNLGGFYPANSKIEKPGFFDFFRFDSKIFDHIDYKIAYDPILFGWEDSAAEPIFTELFKRQIEQVTIGVDILTSTSSERITDAILQFVADALAMLATCTAFLPAPGAVTAGLSMLFGFGSAGTDFVRGELEDDQELAAQHKANALRGAVFELIGPFVSKRIGKVLSGREKSRIHSEIFNRLRSSGRLPDDVAKYIPIKKSRPAIIKKAQKLPKWIPPVARDSFEINSVVNRKFINYRTANRMSRLGEGPEVAQKLMDTTGITYYAGPEKGYVYKGVVMRGDMRPPSEVFSEGFQLRTSVSDINQVNGMRGGFGGGKDALDPDGMGISTSAFYKKSGAGAYQYGGAKGGYTYVINGKDLEGFHLYRNHNLAAHPRSRLGFEPLEINYGTNIPPSKILGAYDANGVFYPNPNALAGNIASSTPPAPPMRNPAPKKSRKANTTTTSPTTRS